MADNARFDALVIGAGFSDLYTLRQLGIRTRASSSYR
jgi:cation diffusion facilitator CzcD-associated flavoprotein CzcO